jgi:PST family polysaccharide transporter
MTTEPQPGYDEIRQGAFAGVRAMLVRHVLIAAVSAVGTTWLIRELGPSAWGGFAIAYMLLVSCDTILTRCLLIGLMRREQPADAAALRSAARLVMLAGLACAAVLCVLAAVIPLWYDPPRLRLLLFAGAACAVLYAARALSVTMLERELRYGPVAASEVLDMVAFYAVAGVGVGLGGGVEVLALATVARGVAALMVARRARPTPLLGGEPRNARATLLPIGLPLAAVTVVSALDGLVPSAAIGDMEREVGFFVTSVTILGYALSLMVAVGRVGVPSFGMLDGVARASAAVRAASLSTFLSLLAIVPAAATADLWLAPLLGDEWDAAVGIFRWIAVGAAVAGLIGVATAGLTAVGRTGLLLRLQVLGTGMYAAFAVAGAIAWDAEGAAAGYAVSRWILAGVFVVESGRALGRGWLRPALVLATGIVPLGCAVAAGSDSTGAEVAVLAATTGVWVLVWRDLLRTGLGALVSRLRPAAR